MGGTALIWCSDERRHKSQTVEVVKAGAWPASDEDTRLSLTGIEQKPCPHLPAISHRKLRMLKLADVKHEPCQRRKAIKTKMVIIHSFICGRIMTTLWNITLTLTTCGSIKERVEKNVSQNCDSYILIKCNKISNFKAFHNEASHF